MENNLAIANILTLYKFVEALYFSFWGRFKEAQTGLFPNESEQVAYPAVNYLVRYHLEQGTFGISSTLIQQVASILEDSKNQINNEGALSKLDTISKAPMKRSQHQQKVFDQFIRYSLALAKNPHYLKGQTFGVSFRDLQGFKSLTMFFFDFVSKKEYDWAPVFLGCLNQRLRIGYRPRHPEENFAEALACLLGDYASQGHPSVMFLDCLFHLEFAFSNALHDIYIVFKTLTGATDAAIILNPTQACELYAGTMRTKANDILDISRKLLVPEQWWSMNILNRSQKKGITDCALILFCIGTILGHCGTILSKYSTHIDADKEKLYAPDQSSGEPTILWIMRELEALQALCLQKKIPLYSSFAVDEACKDERLSNETLTIAASDEILNLLNGIGSLDHFVTASSSNQEWDGMLSPNLPESTVQTFSHFLKGSPFATIASSQQVRKASLPLGINDKESNASDVPPRRDSSPYI